MSKGESTLTDSIESCASRPQSPQGRGAVRTGPPCMCPPCDYVATPALAVLDFGQYPRTLLPEGPLSPVICVAFGEPDRSSSCSRAIRDPRLEPGFPVPRSVG